MSRFVKQFVTLSVVIVLFFAFGYLPAFSPTAIIGRKVNKLLAQYGVLSQIEKIDYNFPLGVSIKDLGLVAQVSRIPIALFFDTIRVHLGVSEMFSLKKYGEMRIECYGGRIIADLLQNFFSDEVFLGISIKDIDLVKHPGLSWLGIAGKLAAQGQVNLRSVTGNFSDVKFGRYYLKLKNGFYRGGYEMYGLFKLPQIKDLSFSATILQEDRYLTFEKVAAYSSLANASFKGDGELKDHGLVDLDLEGTINLTSQGKEILGGYLALAAQSSVDNPARNWGIRLLVENSSIKTFQVNPVT